MRTRARGPTFTAYGIGPGQTNFFQFTTDRAGTNPITGPSLLTIVRPAHRFLFMDTNASHAPRRSYRVLETC